MTRSIFAAAILAVGAGFASAGTVDFFGDNTGGPVYNRVLSGNPPTLLSAVGTAVHYQTWDIQVDANGSYDFTTNLLSIPDSFMSLYSSAGFVPANALLNCLVADDDAGPGAGSFFSYALNAGSTYTVVVTGFANEHVGTYNLHIEGPGNITPAPGAMALLGLGGLIAGRRRR